MGDFTCSCLIVVRSTARPVWTKSVAQNVPGDARQARSISSCGCAFLGVTNIHVVCMRVVRCDQGNFGECSFMLSVYILVYSRGSEELVPEIPADLQPDMTVPAVPVRILERRIKELRRKKIPLLRILWDCGGCQEETWEPEAKMKVKFRKWFDEQVGS